MQFGVNDNATFEHRIEKAWQCAHRAGGEVMQDNEGVVLCLDIRERPIRPTLDVFPSAISTSENPSDLARRMNRSR